jgi:hypothetical protein
MRDFASGGQQTSRDDRFAVLPAAAQAGLEGLDRRRQDENADGLRETPLDLLGALPVDL